jgi:hypothetical protein
MNFSMTNQEKCQKKFLKNKKIYYFNVFLSEKTL